MQVKRIIVIFVLLVYNNAIKKQFGKGGHYAI